MAQMLKYLPAMQETQVPSLGHEDSLEKGMATHSSVLAWRSPWTEESCELQSMGCKELDTTEGLTLSHFHFQSSPCARSCSRYLSLIRNKTETLNLMVFILS